MARVCQVTGKKVSSGNNVSHSNRKTKRTFKPNLFKKKYYLESEDRWVILKVSTSGMKTINKNGLEATLKKAKAEGHITQY